MLLLVFSHPACFIGVCAIALHSWLGLPRRWPKKRKAACIQDMPPWYRWVCGKPKVTPKKTLTRFPTLQRWRYMPSSQMDFASFKRDSSCINQHASQQLFYLLALFYFCVTGGTFIRKTSERDFDVLINFCPRWRRKSIIFFKEKHMHHDGLCLLTFHLLETKKVARDMMLCEYFFSLSLGQYRLCTQTNEMNLAADVKKALSPASLVLFLGA